MISAATAFALAQAYGLPATAHYGAVKEQIAAHIGFVYGGDRNDEDDEVDENKEREEVEEMDYDDEEIEGDGFWPQ